MTKGLHGTRGTVGKERHLCQSTIESFACGLPNNTRVPYAKLAPCRLQVDDEAGQRWKHILPMAYSP